MHGLELAVLRLARQVRGLIDDGPISLRGELSDLISTWALSERVDLAGGTAFELPGGGWHSL